MSLMIVTNDHAVNVLRALYPSQNWTWFLAKNRHGLTDGYPKIPFDLNSEEIVYDVRDIHDFAEQFGNGKYSVEQIRHISDDYFETCNPQSPMTELSSILNDDDGEDQLGELGQGGTEALALSAREYALLVVALYEIKKQQLSSASALTVLAFSLRAAATDQKNIGAHEIEAVANVATEQASCAVDNAQSVIDIVNALERRLVVDSPVHIG
jgi:hypothetical protein